MPSPLTLILEKSARTITKSLPALAIRRDPSGDQAAG
jgi:hypothetical protein